jgi:hypothetical protein
MLTAHAELVAEKYVTSKAQMKMFPLKLRFVKLHKPDYILAAIPFRRTSRKIPDV